MKQTSLLLFLFVIAGVCITQAAPVAADAKMEAHLVWGTNDQKSPDPKHKRIDDELKKRLQELPLKWTNYFEVNKKNFALPNASSQKVTLSDKCSLEVKSLPDNQVTVSLVGRGEHVVKRTQPLPKGEILVLGGNAPNETAWLVVVKRVE